MFLNSNLRQKALEMKKYNNLLDNSLSPKTSIYTDRLYLQKKNEIIDLKEQDFEEIVFVNEEIRKPTKTKSDKVNEEDKNDETDKNISILPDIPQDNKKTIVISQKVLQSAKIERNIFSDDDDEKETVDDDKNLFGGNKDLVIHSFF